MTLMLAAAGGTTWEDRIERTLPAWKGAFSLVILAADRVIAVRDPWGFRPMSVGRLPHGGWAVASETCALGHARLRRHQRGRARRDRHAAAAPRSPVARRMAPAARSARCSFEFVYFSRPDSVWDGRNVHHVRQRLGEELAAEAPADADVVIPVPDSSIPAAIGYSRASGIPHNDGLIKNRYIGRTFIEPTQDMRERGVALKFNALQREPRRQARRDDRRLARSRHHGGPAREAAARRRRHRGAPADHLPADHPRLPLRRRHGPRRRPDGGTPDRSRRSASTSVPTRSRSCRSTG